MTPTPDTKCARCGHARRLHLPRCLRLVKTRAVCGCPAFVEPDATETIVIW